MSGVATSAAYCSRVPFQSNGPRRTHPGPAVIRREYVYARCMTEVAVGRPKRKTMFLGVEALADLATTAARRRTEREAVEDGLRLLAEHDRRVDAMDEFIEWARTEWGEPTAAEKTRADVIWQLSR